MNIYGIYNLDEKEQCVKIGTLKEIVKFLNLTARELETALKKNSTIRKKYKIYYLFKEREVQKWNT